MNPALAPTLFRHETGQVFVEFEFVAPPRGTAGPSGEALRFNFANQIANATSSLRRSLSVALSARENARTKVGAHSVRVSITSGI